MKGSAVGPPHADRVVRPARATTGASRLTDPGPPIRPAATILWLREGAAALEVFMVDSRATDNASR